MSQLIKKIIAILIALIFVITSIQFSFGAQQFKDMSNHWSKVYVDEMVSKGILSGYSDGTFKPEVEVTKLEALLTLSRLFDQSQVESIYAANKSKYESDFSKHSIPSWAQKSLVFCIEKGIFDKNEISYLMENGAQAKAKRWEIPEYIGKAVGYSDSGKVYVLDFDDVEKIPSRAMPYIGALVEKKIISGQTEYPSKKVMFNPYGAVKRGEMAKILKLSSALLPSSNSSGSGNTSSSGSDTSADTVMSVSGQVSSIAESNGQAVIVIETSTGTKLTFSNTTSNVTVKLGGSSAAVSSIKKGDNVKLKVSGEKLVSVEIQESEESVEGYFVRAYFQIGSDGLSKTFIEVKEGSKSREFAIDSKSDVEIDGKDASVYDIKEDDKVELKSKNGTVTSIEVLSQDGSVKGYIKEINESKEYMVITDKDDDDKEYKFDIDDDVTIKRNGDKKAKLSDLKIGDEVDVDIEYSVIVEIDAESVSQDVEGVLKEIVISSDPKVTILDSKGKLRTYELAPDFSVEIDDKSAGLYDLRLNYEVELKLETNEVTEIECDEKVTVTTITGEIMDVDTSDNVIKMKDNSTKNTIYVKYTSSTTLENYSGKSLKEGDFDDEDVISVIGEDQFGTIKAERIIRIK